MGRPAASGAPVAISDRPSASYPAAAFTDGALVAVWTEGDPAASRIAVRRQARVQVNDSGGFFYDPAPGGHGSAGAEVRW